MTVCDGFCSTIYDLQPGIAATFDAKKKSPISKDGIASVYQTEHWILYPTEEGTLEKFLSNVSSSSWLPYVLQAESESVTVVMGDHEFLYVLDDIDNEDPTLESLYVMVNVAFSNDYHGPVLLLAAEIKELLLRDQYQTFSEIIESEYFSFIIYKLAFCLNRISFGETALILVDYVIMEIDNKWEISKNWDLVDISNIPCSPSGTDDCPDLLI